MNPIEAILCDEIFRERSVSFHRFMELALYHPEYGYYRRRRDPFGKEGDYYTAEQLEPVFGILIARRIRALFEEMEPVEERVVVELGAGRAEMAEFFREFRYIPVDLERGALPDRFSGVVFANEFFDALPVHLVIRRGGVWREMRVGRQQDRFAWVESEPASAEIEDYVRRYSALEDEGALVEVNLDALRWLERIGRSLERGFVLAIDYGYTTPESVRFPRGTLMSYRRHQASEDVLANPGEQDITAHVCFTALERHGEEHGLRAVRLETLAQTLLAAGERDGFAAALAGETETERLRRRLQLKSLLFGMGETFRTLLQRKGEETRREK